MMFKKKKKLQTSIYEHSGFQGVEVCQISEQMAQSNQDETEEESTTPEANVKKRKSFKAALTSDDDDGALKYKGKNPEDRVTRTSSDIEQTVVEVGGTKLI